MYQAYINRLNMWAKNHLLGLFVFNTIIVILVLLNTAQYFRPYLFIGINTIFFISMILSILLLGARSKTLFLISLFFFIFGSVLKILDIDVWADRASIYFYQAFFIGILLLLFKK